MPDMATEDHLLKTCLFKSHKQKYYHIYVNISIYFLLKITRYATFEKTFCVDNEFTATAKSIFKRITWFFNRYHDSRATRYKGLRVFREYALLTLSFAIFLFFCDLPRAVWEVLFCPSTRKVSYTEDIPKVRC